MEKLIRNRNPCFIASMKEAKIFLIAVFLFTILFFPAPALAKDAPKPVCSTIAECLANIGNSLAEGVSSGEDLNAPGDGNHQGEDLNAPGGVQDLNVPGGIRPQGEDLNVPGNGTPPGDGKPPGNGQSSVLQEIDFGGVIVDAESFISKRENPYKADFKATESRTAVVFKMLPNHEMQCYYPFIAAHVTMEIKPEAFDYLRNRLIPVSEGIGKGAGVARGFAFAISLGKVDLASKLKELDPNGPYVANYYTFAEIDSKLKAIYGNQGSKCNLSGAFSGSINEQADFFHLENGVYRTIIDDVPLLETNKLGVDIAIGGKEKNLSVSDNIAQAARCTVPITYGQISGAIPIAGNPEQEIMRRLQEPFNNKDNKLVRFVLQPESSPTRRVFTSANETAIGTFYNSQVFTVAENTFRRQDFENAMHGLNLCG